MVFHIPKFLAPRLSKSVAVFGGGRSGEAVLALFERLGARGVLYDEKLPPSHIPPAKHTFTSTQAREHSLVIFSPGFPPDHKWLVTAREHGCETLGELDFASLFWQGRVIAITGTNGKTTLTEFLTHALRSGGWDAESTGNIGAPFTALVNRRDSGACSDNGSGDVVTAVVEVSSFQAETLKHFRAGSALWTNFAEDHLERHHGLRDYFDAKLKLLNRVDPDADGGFSLAGLSVQRHAAALHRPLPRNTIIIPTEAQPPDPRLAGTVFEHYPQYENFLLALAWWFHPANALPADALYAAARTFRLGRHRLQRIAEINGVAYWNDSKATNFHAVEGALAQFTSATPILLILGGLAKGGDIPAFVRRIAPRVKHALIIGATAPELAAAFQSTRTPHTRCATLADAVGHAAALAQKGDAVLLSPAFASFDMFHSYEDRGDQFEKLVSKLAAAPNANANQHTAQP